MEVFKGKYRFQMKNSLDNKVNKKNLPTKIGAIIQARIGSRRLPGKSLMDVGGKPILQHIIENLKTSKELSSIILVTTDKKEDIPLLKLVKKLDISGFAGSENDVLSRYAEAAEMFEMDVIVRVTGDNILTDVAGMLKTIDVYFQNKSSLASNGGEQGYPLGSAVEVLSTDLLKTLNNTVNCNVEREHVTLHVYRHPEKYRIAHLKAPPAYRDFNIRLTIDTPEDISLIRLLYKKLKERNEKFTLHYVIEYLKKHKDLTKINAHIEQRRF
tara:strand:+ start:2194 stop:3003 length:810 start_codon:yes stop_codon:yes gene_type:complete